MGHRANELLIRRGHVHVFYDRWGALGIPDCLSVGPKETLARFARRAKQRGEDQHLLDSVWCEGFVCVDDDRRVVLFDDGQSQVTRDDRTIRVFANSLWDSWTGWELWFVGPGVGGGIDRVACYAGLAPSKGSKPAYYDQPLDDVNIIEAMPSQSTDRNFHHLLLVRLREAPGSFQDSLLGLTPFQVLTKGLSVIDLLRTFKPLPIDYQVTRKAFLEIDVAVKAIRAWEIFPEYGLKGCVDKNFPGWTLKHLTETDILRYPDLTRVVFLTDQQIEAAQALLLEQHFGEDRVEQMIGSYRQMIANLI